MTGRITTSKKHGEGADLRPKRKKTNICALKPLPFPARKAHQSGGKVHGTFAQWRGAGRVDIAFEEAALSWRCCVFVGPVAVVFWNERQPYNHAVTINTDLYWILLILRLWLLIQRGENNSMWTASMQHTLQGINISHLGKRKIIFKMPFLGDMLVPWRVLLQFWNLWQIYECCIRLWKGRAFWRIISRFQLMVTSKGSIANFLPFSFSGVSHPLTFLDIFESHGSLLPFPQKKQQDPYTSPGELATVCTWKSWKMITLDLNPPKPPEKKVTVYRDFYSFFYMFHNPGSIAVLLVPLGGDR